MRLYLATHRERALFLTDDSYVLGMKIRLISLVLSSLFFCGFDLSNSSIPLEEIEQNGPPRDQIPVLTDPEVVPVREADFLANEDQVLGIALAGEARAYPIRILNWHEIINDSIGNEHFSLFFCPLCGTGLAFQVSQPDDSRTLFGFSGLRYGEETLLYDQETESLWSQLLLSSIAGKRKGEELSPLPVIQTTWERWKKQYPGSEVLSLETGYQRDYSRNPFRKGRAGLKAPSHPMKKYGQYEAKDWVMGIVLNETARAYPFPELQKRKTKKGSLIETVGNTRVKITYDLKAREMKAELAGVKEQNTLQTYWYLWNSFYPDSSVYADE